MALRKRGEWRYGDSQADIRAEIVRYSRDNGYASQFADAACPCGGAVFGLLLDDNRGVAIRNCVACEAGPHPIGDSAEFIDGATPADCECECGGEAFEITVGVSLFTNGEDVRWVYIGCRCPACGRTAVYGDWRSGFNGYRELLARV
jgi:Zn ribbon nucleic-acid-binding protein